MIPIEQNLCNMMHRFVKEHLSENIAPYENLGFDNERDMLNAYHEYMAHASDIRNQITERDMKTIHLPLKKEWYEMIESGIKTEEYREIKPYWEKRLVDYKAVVEDYRRLVFRRFVLGAHNDICKDYPRGYTHVKFSYGYTKRTMTFEIKEISIGKGNPEWGAPKEDVFIIKLGKKL